MAHLKLNNSHTFQINQE